MDAASLKVIYPRVQAVYHCIQALIRKGPQNGAASVPVGGAMVDFLTALFRFAHLRVHALLTDDVLERLP